MSLVLLCEGKTKCFKSDSKTKPRLKTLPTYSYFENVNYCRKKCERNSPDRSTIGGLSRKRYPYIFVISQKFIFSMARRSRNKNWNIFKFYCCTSMYAHSTAIENIHYKQAQSNKNHTLTLLHYLSTFMTIIRRWQPVEGKIWPRFSPQVPQKFNWLSLPAGVAGGV